MLVRYVMWDLDGTSATIEQLREYLRDESVDAFSQVRGLRFKAWVSDAASNRWGAVYVWEDAEAAQQKLPSRARELIGKDPDVFEQYTIEATVEGVFADGALTRRGLAFE